MSAPRLALLSPAGLPLPERRGLFGEVVPLALEAGAGLAEAVKAAAAAGCDWFVRLKAGERLAEGALDLASPLLALADAVFGAVRVAGALWKPSRLAFDEPARLPHALLNWWVGRPVFARTEALQRFVAAPGLPEASVDRQFRLWRELRCIKLAAPLLDLDREPDALSADDRAAVVERLARAPVFLDIPHGERVWRLPYTGLNAGIEREQTRGLFFEASELEWLKREIGPGASVVDVGANTGNHTVFFAGPMAASAVTPFEPLPDAAQVLARTVAENRLLNVDLSHLGTGVSDRPGRARVVRSQGGGLGATRLEEDPAGEVALRPLDDLVSGPCDLLKIDVEGMEMAVLAGAERLVARTRPRIFIEIANRNTLPFLHWLEGAGYTIRRVFSDKGHANYLIAPAAG